MRVIVNTATVVPLLDEAFASAGYTLPHEGREAWKANAAQAAAWVQNHAGSSNLEPESFEVDVDEHGWTAKTVADAARDRAALKATIESRAAELAVKPKPWHF